MKEKKSNTKKGTKELENVIQKKKINDNIIIVLLSIILIMVAILVYVKIF